MKVEVVRSSKRRKTVQLRPTPDGVRVSIPARATKAEEEQYVKDLVAKYLRKKNADRVDLKHRATRLAIQYDLPMPLSIKWVDNQVYRWGSCTPSTATIRISSRAHDFPLWVLDYIIIHELAHLVHHGHGPEFWWLVDRYELKERAHGYLIAKANQLDSDADALMDSDVELEPSHSAADDSSAASSAGTAGEIVGGTATQASLLSEF